VGIVREITEFYYRKGEGDYRWGLCQVEWRYCVQKKREGFYFRAFLCHP
jgi:hypothetical protein